MMIKSTSISESKVRLYHGSQYANMTDVLAPCTRDRNIPALFVHVRRDGHICWPDISQARGHPYPFSVIWTLSVRSLVRAVSLSEVKYAARTSVDVRTSDEWSAVLTGS